MTTICFWHPASVEHDPGPGHSERSARLTAIIAALQAELPELEWCQAPRGMMDDITRVHSQAYADFVFKAVPATGYRVIEVNEIVSGEGEDEVTTLSPHSGEALLRAVGAVTAGVDHAMQAEGTRAFCLTRPPGHHALADKAMGFCVFNHAAIAARYAQNRYKVDRVAIVDFDVHHGNGTQAIFLNDASVFFASIHQLPLWPESGYTYETGLGNILNVPTAPGLPRDEWLKLWRDMVLTRLRVETFDLLIISAGFDAHRNDPKGSQNLETADYYAITIDLLKIVEEKCSGRVISILEGGYDIDASAASATAHAAALLGKPLPRMDSLQNV